MMIRAYRLLVFVLLAILALNVPAVGKTELQMQYEVMQRDIANCRQMSKYADQAFRSEALILNSDRDPLDVILRRTVALLDDLIDMSSVQPLATMSIELKKLQNAGSEVAVTDTQRRGDLFKKAFNLRRRIALSNPLLDFNKILFIKRHRATFNHMCDQYYGINILPGGGIYVLSDPFGENPRLRDVLADSVVQRGRLKGRRLIGGSFLSPDLSYDGKTIVFAYVECRGDRDHRHHTDPSRGHWNWQRCYHIFKVNVDGSGLEQLTDGTNPFSYPRLVQPVLDKHCVQCHADNPNQAPRLDREVIAKGNQGRQRWYASYHSLAPEYGFWQYGGRHRTIPGKFGARVSKLYKLLQEGHYDVKLSEEEMHRVIVWLDSCSMFYGVYEKEGGIAQLQGKVVYPTLE